ncbi:hypothetical protein K7H20_24145 [Salipiger manganoxidans]|uniref:hypothetical protein n=1 Tax=Salipiger marinus TaxID=555512 RepID=UPI001E53B2C0|nr:hypothetical protein [Salipiger manganoxidans]MCD1621133.1 hypothetical protein [Salipiger manganoxidans]
MSGKAQALTIVSSVRLPLAHLSFDLTVSVCGNRMWALRFDPDADMNARPVALANGFCDTAEQRSALAADLREIADYLELQV